MTSVIFIPHMQVLPVSRPAKTTGSMRWPVEGLGSRRNLIRSCAVRLQADYEKSRAAWRQVHPARGRVDSA